MDDLLGFAEETSRLLEGSGDAVAWKAALEAMQARVAEARAGYEQFPVYEGEVTDEALRGHELLTEGLRLADCGLDEMRAALREGSKERLRRGLWQIRHAAGLLHGCVANADYVAAVNDTAHPAGEPKRADAGAFMRFVAHEVALDQGEDHGVS